MRAFSVLLMGVSILWTVLAFGQSVLPPTVEWEKVYGGDEADRAVCLVRTMDNGWLTGGRSYSGVSGNKSTPNYGGHDFWVLRLDASGNKVWEGNFGGTGDDLLSPAQQTSDGGFVLAGESWSGASGNKTSDLIGVFDFWVVRLDANGNKLWDKSYGGTGTDSASCILQTSDGGFLVGGISRSSTNGNKTSAPLGYQDYWIARLDAQGNKLWDRSYGGGANDILTDMRPMSDGGFLLAGYSDSPAGAFKGSTNYGGSDLWLVRIDANRNQLWDRGYGGTADELSARLAPAGDGGWFLGGSTLSGVGGNKTSPFYSTLNLLHDYWVLRLDAQGDKLWEHGLGGSRDDFLTDIQVTLDGGVIVGGLSGSEASGNKNAPRLRLIDAWLVRLDRTGTKAWDQTFTSSMDVGLSRVVPTPDGGIMIAAHRAIATEAQTADLLLMKLSAETLRGPVPPPTIEWQRTFGGTNGEMVWGIEETSDGGYVVVGETRSEVSGNKTSSFYGSIDGWVIRLDRHGDKVWESSFGGDSHDWFRDVRKLPDGGFILVGESHSGPSGNKTSGAFGLGDFWIVRVDAEGNKVWEQSFGGTQSDEGYSVALAGDGGFWVGGTSRSPVSGNKTSEVRRAAGDPSLRPDQWLIRLDADGNKVWENTFGGFDLDYLHKVSVMPDGGVVLTGTSYSGATGNKTSTNNSMDSWIVRLDNAGNMVWDRSLGGISQESGGSVVLLADGGMMSVAVSDSPATGNKSAALIGGYDYWLTRLNGNGDMVWDKALGGTDWDIPNDLQKTMDGGFILAGHSKSPPSGTKTTSLINRQDVWLVRLDQEGQQVWDLSLSAPEELVIPHVRHTKDGGYVVAATKSQPGPIPVSGDFVIIKLTADSLTAPKLNVLVGTGTDCRFQILGRPGRTYVTEWSSDLRTWSPLVTNRLMSGAAEIVDGAGEGRRFYRARMVE